MLELVLGLVNVMVMVRARVEFSLMIRAWG